MDNFKIGDRVVAIKPIGWDTDHRTVGTKGTIVDVDDFSTNKYVVFDSNIRGHDFNKKYNCLEGHGWVCGGKEIELISDITNELI